MPPLATVCTRRELCHRAVRQAALSPEALVLAFLAPVAAIALGSWWILGAGIVSYAAMMVRRLLRRASWQEAARPKEDELPEPCEIADPDLRGALSAVRDARNQLDEAATRCSPGVARMFQASLDTVDRLVPTVQRLVRQTEALTRWLAAAAPTRVRLELTSAEERARSSAGAVARAQYEAAGRSCADTLRTLEQLAHARAAGVACLWRLAATLESFPTRMVWLDFLGEQAKADPVHTLEVCLRELESDTRALEATVRGVLAAGG